MEVRDYVPRNAMAVLATLPIVLLMKKPEEGSKSGDHGFTTI